MWDEHIRATCTHEEYLEFHVADVGANRQVRFRVLGANGNNVARDRSAGRSPFFRPSELAAPRENDINAFPFEPEIESCHSYYELASRAS